MWGLYPNSNPNYGGPWLWQPLAMAGHNRSAYYSYLACFWHYYSAKYEYTIQPNIWTE